MTQGHTMLQNYYDEQNDRFFIVPLRCGSTYTDRMAANLGWRHLDDVFKEYKDEKSGPLIEHIPYFEKNEALKVLCLLKSQKYRNSHWVTFVRNPWTRYLSGAALVLDVNFDAPPYVPMDEVVDADKMLQDSVKGVYNNHFENSPFSVTDRKINNHFMNSINLDYTLGDNHLLPLLALQMMLYFENPDNFQIFKLEEMSEFYKNHYPPGEAVQQDYYELLEQGKREGSDTPSTTMTGIYKRFLATTQWYNPVIAKRVGLTTTFYDFIQYEIDVWSQFTEYGIKDGIGMANLFGELLKEPYFYLRHKRLYQFYAIGASSIQTESHLFNQVNLAMPKIREFVLENSWINVQLESTF